MTISKPAGQPTLDHATALAAARQELLTAAPEVAADADSGAHLRHDLGIDSLTLLEFVARLEFRFQLSVADADWPSLDTLDRVAAYLVDHA